MSEIFLKNFFEDFGVGDQGRPGAAPPDAGVEGSRFPGISFHRVASVLKDRDVQTELLRKPETVEWHNN